jgi:hypothetical protein
MSNYKYIEEYLVALEDSVSNKWAMKAKGTLQNTGECKVCIVSEKYDVQLCDSCPIFLYTGGRVCSKTPFLDYVKETDRLEQLQHAKRMLALLRRIRNELREVKKNGKVTVEQNIATAFVDNR